MSTWESDSRLWRDYVAAHPEHVDEEPPVDRFGDSPALADELLALVVAGGKRATAGPVDADQPIVVGSHWVVTDGDGTPTLVLRTSQVRTGRLDSVDDAFARDEGEGDLSRASWLEGHRAYVRRVLGLGTGADVDHVELVFERFTVVWPPAHADD